MAELKSKHIKDISGRRFGRITVLAFADIFTNQGARWHCKCDCGNTLIIRGASLKCGDTKSCGCYKLDKVVIQATTHGMHKTRENLIWRKAKNRCYCTTNTHYSYYGGRGIQMCERWKNSFAAFLEDMGPCPSGMTLERVNVDGDYEPTNCRWATRKEQMNNRRDTIRITHDGITLPLSEWADRLNIGYATLAGRHAKGLSIFEPKYMGRRTAGGNDK